MDTCCKEVESSKEASKGVGQTQRRHYKKETSNAAVSEICFLKKVPRASSFINGYTEEKYLQV